MPLTITITQEVKEFVDTYLLNNDPTTEKGGFLLGNNYQLLIPRFFPNMSSTPYQSYKIPENWDAFLRCDLKLFNMNWYCFFHSHPHHIILSEVDLKVMFKSPIELLMMYDNEKACFSWRAYDKSGVEQYLEIIDKNYPTFQQYFARSLGLLNIGSCLITINGEILCSNHLGRAFISIDMDALNLYNLLKKDKHLSKVKMKELLGISLTRLDKALEKLQKNELLKEE